MDNRVLERIVIIILLLLDLFLLSVVLTDRAEARRSAAETAARAAEVLRSNGVTVAEGVVTVQSAPAKCTLQRSGAREQSMAKELLRGSVSVEDLGGNILYYRSAKGQAVLRGSGETEALLNRGAVEMRGSPEKTCTRILRKMGLSAELCGAGINASDGETYAEFFCCREAYPVFNAVLRFDFSGDSVYLVTGTRIFDSLTKSDDSGLLDSVSALMRFAEFLQQSEEFSCTQLDSFRPGYLASVPVSGETLLTPVWRLETDGGIFTINAENGRIENSAA